MVTSVGRKNKCELGDQSIISYQIQTEIIRVQNFEPCNDK